MPIHSSIRAYNTETPEEIVLLCGTCARRHPVDVIEGYDLSDITPDDLTCDLCERPGIPGV